MNDREPNDQELLFVEALATVRPMARLWFELLTASVAEGMTPAQALKVVCAYVHGSAGGRLET